MGSEADRISLQARGVALVACCGNGMYLSSFGFGTMMSSSR